MVKEVNVTLIDEDIGVPSGMKFSARKVSRTCISERRKSRELAHFVFATFVMAGVGGGFGG